MGSELAEALAKVQAELKPIPRNAEGQAGTRKRKYADLAAVSEAVLPLLSRAGLVFLAKPTVREDGRFVLAYSLIHTSGEREDGEYPMHGGGGAQQQGSEVTYARRYALCAITGAAPEGEDDDGAAASRGRAPARTRPPSRPSAPVTPTRTTGPDHERLRHGTVEPTPDDRPAQRNRGPVPDDENPWQDLPPEEKPGSADPADVKKIQMAYGKLGFDSRTDRAQLLSISKQIIGRPLAAPGRAESHNNLSHSEARKLRDTLESFGSDRGALMERLAGVTQAVAAVTAQNAAEDPQDGAS